jgi:DNA-directed RNA polymerase specialized sigma24 family protein
MDADPRTDEQLTQSAGAGDHEAFSALYRRHFVSIYDFVVRVARDRNVAALVVQASFLGAYATIRAGEAQVPFRLILFANAHTDLVDRLRRRGGGEAPPAEAFTAIDAARLADPAVQAESAEIGAVAWQAAEAVRLDDYELVDLRSRHEFDTGELASLLRTRPDAAQSRLARAEASYGEAFSALLLASRGRRACVDLDFLIGDDATSGGQRRRIARHLQSCQTCQATRSRYPSANDGLAALVPVAAPAGWQETILSRLQGAAGTGRMPAVAPVPVQPVAAVPPDTVPAVAAGAGATDGLGDWISNSFSSGRGPLAVVLGAALLILALILGALCATGAFEGEDRIEGTATPVGTATGTPTPSGTATRTPTETGTAAPTVEPATSTPAAPTQTAMPTELPPPTSTPVPPPTERPVRTQPPPTPLPGEQ